MRRIRGIRMDMANRWAILQAASWPGFIRSNSRKPGYGWYDQIDGSYDSSIFTAEKHGKSLEDAFRASKAIQDYVYTDGTADKSIERQFVESLDGSAEVNIYAKLPRGFSIPTPVGHYSPDWAIVFHEGKVRHIYFVAETKGTMDTLNLRPIEKAKIDCAKKLFATLSNGSVKYDHVDSYRQLLNKVMN